jgi:peroxiredoxin
MKRLVVLSFLIYSFEISKGQRTIISGDITNLATTTIKCSFIPNTVLEKVTVITIPVTGGRFSQELPISNTTFLSFEEGSNYFGGFIQPGDSIEITYDAAKLKSTLFFSGKGKEKFILADSINQLRTMLDEERANLKNQAFPVDYFFKKVDSLQYKLLQAIIFYKSAMSNESFNSLNALVKASVLRTKFNGVMYVIGDASDSALKRAQPRLTSFSKKAITDLLLFDNNLSHSYFYINDVATFLSIYYDHNKKSEIGHDLQAKYSYLKGRIPVKLQSSVLLLLLIREIRQNREAAIESIVEELYPSPQDSVYKTFITQRLADARALKVGTTAPDFVLENVNGENINLSTFKGKVVYIDFWFAACGPCHKLFNEIKSAKEFFKSDSNVVFLTVSVDGIEVWKKALAKFKIGGYHAFTENKFRNHPIIRNYNVLEYPTTYLIDKNGTIVNVKPSHSPGELRKEIENVLNK